MPRALAILGTLFVTGLLAAVQGPASDAAQQTASLWLPWEGGTAWQYSYGPHSGSGAVPDALDFQPPDAAGKPCELFTSSFWVVAAANGKVISRPNGLEIDHGGGFRTGYFHLADKQVQSGNVRAGDRLGRPGCCPDGKAAGCWSLAPHLHFYSSFRGARQSIIGLNLGGWVVQADGCLLKEDREACPQARLISNAPRPDAPRPSQPADVVLVMDASASMSAGARGAVRLKAALAYLEASTPEDRVAVVEFNSTARIRSRLRPPGSGGLLDRGLVEALRARHTGGATNMRAGVIAACRQLVAWGKAAKRAAILLSDGKHNRGDFGQAQRCFAGRGWPVFTYGVSGTQPALLERIAESTGGQFALLQDIESLPCEFQRVRMLISGDKPYPCSTYVLRRKEELSLHVSVPPEQAQAAFAISWKTESRAGPLRLFRESSIEMTLTAPSGHSIRAESGSRRVTHEKGANKETYTISLPQAGEWTIRLLAADVPARGETVTVTVTTVPLTPLPGTAVAEPLSVEIVEPVPEETPAPEETPSQTETPTPEPSDSPSPTESLEPSPPGEGSPTETPSPEPVPTPTPTGTEAPSPEPP